MLRAILFALLAMMASTHVFAVAIDTKQGSMVKHALYSLDARQPEHEVVFVDTQVSDYDTLISNLRSGIEVIVLDAGQDSVSQITSALQQKRNVSALHIFTHGRDGEILFANGILNTANLQNYTSLLAGWSNSLTENADILFYGCNVAEGTKGQAFLHALSEITGADVTASENVTGNEQGGGDWLLEHVQGEVEAKIALTETGMMQFPSTLAPPPVFEKAVVVGDGSELRMTYSKELKQSSIPATSAFTVTATSSGPVSVTGVTVNSDQTVTLTLSGAISYGDTVTLDYTPPGITPIQSTAGDVSIALTAETVSTSIIHYASTFWTVISPSGGSQFDYFTDQQTGQGEGDIVGDGGSNPGFQVHFDDNGGVSNTDGTLSFRFRLAKSGSNFYIVGIDADLDGALDVFIKMDTSNTDEISIYENGGDLNISPSTTDIGAELYAVATTVSTLDLSTVTVIDGNTVTADLDGDTNTDAYVSGSLPFSELVTALASANILISLTDTDPLRYAVATSVNGSTFNQDIAGLPEQYDVDASYVSSGAFSDPVSLDGSIASVQPGTPVINNLSGDTLVYVMNDAVSMIDQSIAATVTDSDDTSLDDAGLLDGSLHVEITAGVDVTEDVLGITEGVVNGATVALSAGYTVNSVVSIDGTAIGTITDIGTGVDALDPEISFTVTFDQVAGSATLANVNTLIQAVTYVNTNIATAAEGVRTVSFLVSDGAFNTEVSTSVTVTQVADITAPLAPTVDLVAGSDSGVSNTDDITNVTTPTISVTFDQSGAAATDAIVGDVVKLFEGLTQVGTATLTASDISNGYVDITSSVLSEGSLSFTATVTDISSNASAASTSLAVSLFTSLTVAVTLADSALIKGETSLVTFTFSTAPTGFTEADITVINGGLTGFTVTGDPAVYTATYTPTDNLEDATNVISVGTGYTDDSGNTGTAANSANYTIDTVAPVVAVTSAPVANAGNRTTYPVSGNCTVGDGSVVVSIAAATPASQSVFCIASASWSATFDVSAIADGNNVISVDASQTDTAGNTGNAATLQANKDTVLPGVDIQGEPAIVNSTKPFNVTAEFSEDVTGFISTDISVTNGSVTSFTPVDGNTYTIEITPGGAGNISIDIIDGVAQDGALNANTAATTVNVAFDITAPAVTITTANTANAANVANYTVAGGCTDADGDVTVSITGANPANQNVTCSADSWVATFDVTAIADGLNALTIQASQTDPANNLSNILGLADKDVVIAAPTVNLLTSNNATPVITGTAEANSTLAITVAGASYTITTDAGGSWSLDTAVTIPDSGTFTLVIGGNDVAVTSVDAAGNSATDNSTNEITLTPDDDNDGIPNSVECPSGPPFDNSCVDSDADGTPDFQDTDSDNDGIPDTNEVGIDSSNPIDSDGDGTPDYRDTDSDNDGIDDSVEGVFDSDGDGIPDYVDVGATGDSDGDGIPDKVECPVFPTDCPDTDSDGSPDYLDTDADNDGIDDAVEAGVDPTLPVDTDGDGTPDYRDTDSDGDSVDDQTEGLTDNDVDGIPDYVDASSAGPVPNAGDSDGDGIADNIECALYPLCADSDNDGMPDYMEIDSDDDGILDVDEAGSALNDIDSDGIDDAFDIDITGLVNGLDQNGDGIDDTQPLDTDGDDIPDYQDTDSDGDGIDDIAECPAGVPCPDADNDGIPDQLDASDGDASGSDITGSGDSDGDGISDANECLTGLPCPDVDQDGIPDYMDDNPNDGPLADFDNDGRLNYLDPDDDNDLIPDVVEDPDFDMDNNPATNPLDSDGDGIPDYHDTDSDNDGLGDLEESGASGNDADNDNIDDSYDIDLTAGVDFNNDGIDDNVTPLDSDADGLPDYLDTVLNAGGTQDTDNDGIANNIECPSFPTNCPDTDGDGNLTIRIWTVMVTVPVMLMKA
jgi:hypothetical protein